MSQYPKRSDPFLRSQRKPDAAGQFVNEVLQESIVVGAMGLWHLLKSFVSRRAIISIPMVTGVAWISYLAAENGYHLLYLHENLPELFTPERINRLWQIPKIYHWFCLISLLLFPIAIGTGIWVRSIRTKFMRIFQRARIVNGLGDTPKLIREQKLDSDRRVYVFDANGIGISRFEERREEIESHFKTNLESIKYGVHKGKILLTFSKQSIPNRIHFTEVLAQMSLPRESFYLGITAEGPKTQGIAELPHMLIAGTTGSGKSTFFKQCLLGLLESSPHLQMYLIDLKSGLEMIDFKKAPNVQVIKDIDSAVKVLGLVEREMKNRFEYLEEAGRKHVVPEIDNKDRIVVAVDEASVLYMNRSRHDPEYEAAVKARNLADSISKLSRAAAIHLLLATQKLDRQVIPTSVSENISGRMAFRANSLQGSMVVLGSKEAWELPEIPGRGLWNFGTSKLIVQTPFIDEKTIRDRCERILMQFQKGQKKMFKSLLGEVEKQKSIKQRSKLAREFNKSKSNKTTSKQGTVLEGDGID